MYKTAGRISPEKLAPKIMRKASQISNSTYKFDLYVCWFVSNKRETAQLIGKTIFMTTCMTIEKLFGEGYNSKIVSLKNVSFENLQRN